MRFYKWDNPASMYSRFWSPHGNDILSKDQFKARLGQFPIYFNFNWSRSSCWQSKRRKSTVVSRKWFRFSFGLRAQQRWHRKSNVQDLHVGSYMYSDTNLKSIKQINQIRYCISLLLFTLGGRNVAETYRETNQIKIMEMLKDVTIQ